MRRPHIGSIDERFGEMSLVRSPPFAFEGWSELITWTLQTDDPSKPNHSPRSVRGHRLSTPSTPAQAAHAAQKVPSADDFPVLGGTATPPLGVAPGHVWGAGGATGAQVLKASLAKAAGESASAKTHEEANGTADANASANTNGEVQKEVETAA